MTFYIISFLNFQFLDKVHFRDIGLFFHSYKSELRESRIKEKVFIRQSVTEHQERPRSMVLPSTLEKLSRSVSKPLSTMPTEPMLMLNRRQVLVPGDLHISKRLLEPVLLQQKSWRMKDWVLFNKTYLYNKKHFKCSYFPHSLQFYYI